MASVAAPLRPSLQVAAGVAKSAQHTRACVAAELTLRRNCAAGAEKNRAAHTLTGCIWRRVDVNVALAIGIVLAQAGCGVVEGDVKYDRGSTLSVARGLHIFRYVGFQGAGVPAVCKLTPPDSGVVVLNMPGRDNGVLQQPGDCLVVRAERASDVAVALRRGSPDGSLDATFRLEPIVLSQDAAPVVAPSAAPLSFLAHLSNRGDTPFAQNVWAGGPDSPAAVEGMQIVAESGVSALELQVLVSSRPPRWSEWVGAGQYAGTRGHGLSLLGFRLRVKPEAQAVEIAAEALFLGALVAAQRGRQVEFVSGTGVDPLIGVKIGLQEVQETSVSRPDSGADAQARDREPRVRVFRASAGR